MNKETFEILVKPLSDKELLYKKHPEQSTNFYASSQTLAKDKEGICIFNFQEQIGNEIHGEIFQGQKTLVQHPNIRFTKQTRFSHIPLHRHKWLEMNYMYSGSCTAIIDEKKVLLKTGDVCILDTKTIHTLEPAGEEDILLNCMMMPQYFNIQFIEHLANSGIIAQFLADVLSDSTARNRYLLFHTAETPIIKELFENALCEYLDPGLCSTNILDNYMTLIFIQLARNYQEDREQEYHRNSRNYITEILRYIEEHCDNCSLTKTAEHFNFHPNALSRTLKNATGFSFQEIVTQDRLRMAAFLLSNSILPVSEIAAQCGWSNQTQFYKKFLENFGCTPKEYRMQYN